MSLKMYNKYFISIMKSGHPVTWTFYKLNNLRLGLFANWTFCDVAFSSVRCFITWIFRELDVSWFRRFAIEKLYWNWKSCNIHKKICLIYNYVLTTSLVQQLKKDNYMHVGTYWYLLLKLKIFIWQFNIQFFFSFWSLNFL